jgi:hypothetical protein
MKMVRPDSNGRITLGHLADNEKWLFANKSALNQVKRGLKDAKEGRLKKRGSFAKYADDEIE